jgi:hypothetical protein
MFPPYAFLLAKQGVIEQCRTAKLFWHSCFNIIGKDFVRVNSLPTLHFATNCFGVPYSVRLTIPDSAARFREGVHDKILSGILPLDPKSAREI